MLWILALILKLLLISAAHRSTIAAGTQAGLRRSLWALQTLLCFGDLFIIFFLCCGELQYSAISHSFMVTCGKILSVLSQRMSEAEISY